IWLSDPTGNEKSWPYQDSTAIPEGWRHFVTRRDHKQPRLELLIDGRAVIAIDDHTRFRPSEPAEAITVGSWPNLSKVHFVNTSVWRLQVRYVTHCAGLTCCWTVGDVAPEYRKF